jgi:hypothetical protein
MVPREIRGPRRFESPSGLTIEAGLHDELEFLHPRFRAALYAAAAAYDQLGIRYALVGGVAAGAYGRPRATRDIDFLVGEEAFHAAGAVLSFKAGVPQEAHDVPIDNIPPHVHYREIYERALDSAVVVDGVRVARAPFVATTKLVGGRPHDIAAIVEMVQAGSVTPEEVRTIVAPYRGLSATLDRAITSYETRR